MKSLTWQQVNALRLSRHGLAPRLGKHYLLDAAARTVGIQAQVMSAAEMALGARVEGVSPGDVQAALWEDRTLIKTWAMRGTLHLLPAAELPLYVAARSVYDARDWAGYFAYYGVNEAQYEAFLAAVPQILGSEPMTREQLATAVAKHIGVPKLGEMLVASSWGSPWKPLAWRGELCFGPNQGRNITFVRPDAWTGTDRKANGHAVEPYEALQEIARRFLHAYGPSTPENFARWWDGGGGVGPARKLFRSLGDELEAVDVEGRQGWALRSDVEHAQGLETSGDVRLLPLFDAYTLGLGRDVEALLPGQHKERVFRPQGWISAVVLVDGYMKGVWEHKVGQSRTTVKVSMFEPHPAWVKEGIEAEAQRLEAFLNSRVALEFVDS